ncbi:hypothetical protein [Aestuariivivens insulae]|uniref:hypothetical protein n=1 Tax=Aestuariivivens insulae TaxID=1621988 RepID=UPI001F59BD8D|nr:hypothetical protein [Aestuariivivens insulae]
MDHPKYYTNKSFKNSLVTCGLILMAIIAVLLARGTEYASSGLFVGLPVLIASIFGVFGTIQLIKGRKEKKSLKFFVALIINGLIVTFFLAAIISNVIDIANAIF